MRESMSKKAERRKGVRERREGRLEFSVNRSSISVNNGSIMKGHANGDAGLKC